MVPKQILPVEYQIDRCEDDHTIVLHKPCGQQVWHGLRLRLDTLITLVEAHNDECVPF